MSEFGNGFLLTVIRLADSGPDRPRIIFRSRIRKLRHHFQLGDRFAAQADRSTDTVISRISTANNQHILALCRNKFLISEVGIQEALRSSRQEIHCKIDSFGISSRCFDITGIGSTTTEYDAVIFF